MTSINNIFGGTPATTFMGLPAGSLDKIEAGIGVLGVPIATPYAVTGPYAAGMAEAVRKAVAGYGNALDNMDFDLMGRIRGDGRKATLDYGDLAADLKDFEANRALIRKTISSMLKAGTVPVVIGGDDSVPIPVYQAFEGHGLLDILLIDAHTDFRDDVNGETLGLSSTMRRASEMSHVGKLVMAGQRSIGSAKVADYEEAVKRDVTIIPARKLHAEGLKSTLDAIPKGRKLWINLDVDALDPSIMPAVIGPAPGGLSFWQVVELIHGAAERTTIAGFSMVEFVPEKDTSGLAALNLARILCNVLGILARQ
ncbi:MAG: arginase family protein [Hyphomicrobiaceae bacterium]